jgi:hypothetical protein
MVDELTMAGDHPEGDVEDATRAIEELNAIAQFLEAVGARPL